MNSMDLLRGMIAATTRLVSGAAPRLIGWTPSSRPTIYFANHSSHLDAVVIWAMLPPKLRHNTRPVAARDYWQKSAARRWVANRVLGAILIDRRGPHGIAASLEALREAMDHGESLILFPEGTRGDGVAVGPFKPGLYSLAQHKPEVDLVPIYLQNLNRILPKGEFLPVPFLSSASFGPVLHLEPGESREAFLVRVRAAVTQLMKEEPC